MSFDRLEPNEENPLILWAEIERLKGEAVRSDGKRWVTVSIEERQRAVTAEGLLRLLIVNATGTAEDEDNERANMIRANYLHAALPDHPMARASIAKIVGCEKANEQLERERERPPLMDEILNIIDSNFAIYTAGDATRLSVHAKIRAAFEKVA